MINKAKDSSQIRAVCSDIDGTLLDVNRELSFRTIAVIRKLADVVPVILASSRMPGAMRHLQHELGILQHPLICYNGGYVIHYHSGTLSPHILQSVLIPAAICSAILNLVHLTSIHVSLYVADQWYAPGNDKWTLREAQITKVNPIFKTGEEVLDLWQGNNAGAHKVMCMGPEEEIRALEVELFAKFQDQIHVYRSKSTYLEIAPKTVSKASALKLLLHEVYNIPLAEAMAFGDNYNDIELLQSVGLGIAVGNARNEVKAVAAEIALNSVDDGVAQSLEKYFNF